MAARPQRRRAADWVALLLVSGLAAAFAAAGAYATQEARNVQETEVSDCSLAAAILQDDTLSPYLIEADRGKILVAASRRFRRCMEDRK